MPTAPNKNLIVLTGGFGLLGRRVQPLLAQQPDTEVINITRNTNTRSNENFTTIHGDLRDETLWRQLPDNVTHVIHLAASIPWNPPERENSSLIPDNVLPITNLCERSKNWPNLKQVIYSSSISVYSPNADWLREDSPRHPTSLYGAAKLAGEELIMGLNAREIQTVSLRFSSLYAHDQNGASVLPLMVNRALRKEPILVFGDGSRTQDFLQCDEAARAVITCFQKEAQGTYNVGSGTPTSMLELANVVSRVFGDTPIQMQPEKVDKDPGFRLDVSKIKHELGFESKVSLEDGLRKLKNVRYASACRDTP